jgi:hypothetical protein
MFLKNATADFWSKANASMLFSLCAFDPLRLGVSGL